MTHLFNTPEMAQGYAASRPAVHQGIAARAKQYLPETFGRALDVGCGCGLSTRVLGGLAKEVLGLEPVLMMAQLAPAVAPKARFVAGAAEALPFTSGSVDLIGAAGSLNYVDLDSFLKEAARVLSPHGVLFIYDFSQGRQSSTAHALSAWFRLFEERHPAPPGHGQVLDPAILRSLGAGFHLVAEESFTVGLPLSRRQYIDYVMTETNVPAAVARGVGLAGIRSWCEETLPSVWPGSDANEQEILFPSYFVCLSPPGELSQIIGT